MPSATTTDEPTEALSAVPSAAPSAEPSAEPSVTAAPTDCAESSASLHIQFVHKGAKSSARRLLMAQSIKIMFSSERSALHEALAKALNLSPNELKLTVRYDGSDVAQVNATFNKETSPRFKESVQRGYELEKRVLNADFDPLPDFNVKRLVMDVEFACADDATETSEPMSPVTSAPTAPAVTLAPIRPYVPAPFTSAPLAPEVTLPPMEPMETVSLSPTAAPKARCTPAENLQFKTIYSTFVMTAANHEWLSENGDADGHPVCTDAVRAAIADAVSKIGELSPPMSPNCRTDRLKLFYVDKCEEQFAARTGTLLGRQ